LKKVLASLAGMFSLGLLSMGLAHANVVPSFSVVGTNPTYIGGGIHEYKYDVTVAGDQMITTGDYLTLYDFLGYVTGGTTPAGWTQTSELVSAQPPLSGTDNPLVSNVVFTYSGPTIGDNNGAAGPEVDLGDFFVQSTFSGLKSIKFHGSGTADLGPGNPDDGSQFDNFGNTRGPSTAPPIVPEPGTLAMLLPGLVPVSLALRRRKSS
jgi:hypothetical protein